MKTHPAITMLQVWAFCIVAFLALPFELVNRTLTAWGLLILGVFIAAFCMGGVVRTLQEQVRGHVAKLKSDRFSSIDFRATDRIFAGVALLCIALLAIQVLQGNFLDLEEAWQIRSDRAVALMMGGESESGILFQICFLLYPASYVILVREIVFRSQTALVRIGGLGFLPIVLMSLVMGGRGPILFALVLTVVALRVRSRLFGASRKPLLQRLTPRTAFLAITFGLISLVALNYFVNVFIVRAESAGGVEAMFDVTATAWGVTFSGPGAEFLFATIGRGNTYLVFVFIWYLVQGLIMCNVLFTDYVGPPHYGVSGLELVTAAMRRINGDFVSDRFLALLDLNTYGFLPSAFGSLFVDFKYFGILVCFFWGYLAAMVYHKTKSQADPRWFLVAPIVLLGIFFSLINTPLGFGNGMMTHLWMVIAFVAARPRYFTAAQRPSIASRLGNLDSRRQGNA